MMDDLEIHNVSGAEPNGVAAAPKMEFTRIERCKYCLVRHAAVDVVKP